MRPRPTQRYLVLLRADPTRSIPEVARNGLPQRLFEGMDQWNWDLGVWVLLVFNTTWMEHLADEAAPESRADAVVRFIGSTRAVFDIPGDDTPPEEGPVMDWWEIYCSSRESAIEWVKHLPNRLPGTSQVVLRALRPNFESK